MTRRAWIAIATVAALAVGAAGAVAQLGGPFGGGRRAARMAETSSDDPTSIKNPPYDGRFTFARIRFDVPPYFGWHEGQPDLKWNHDWPRAERNFMQIVSELSTIRPYMMGGVVLALDDPELMKYPFAYMSEPGFWRPSDAEAAGLRAYLTKGGFIIFDDFVGFHWQTFEAAMRKVLPQGRLVRLDDSHPVFDSFFRIEAPERAPGGYGRRNSPEFWGLFEDNDPDKRLLLVANYNNDIGENWEYSDSGYFPVDITNHAYKLGINYLVYSMTR